MIWKGRPLAGIRAGMEPGALRFAVNAEGLPETVGGGKCFGLLISEI
ncbi:MAG TPA: hypothetical protein H9744_17070 [Candidatus Eisenbergiella stercoravium]|nr:hypothetical protein [Candidatus Eisenbergiella stercoravium]